MLVNVCMITYNHSLYIREAIESILKQETDFNFTLLIGEDNSTDGCREICQQYAARFPEKIRLIISASNVGMMQNFLRTYFACEAPYIAFCEGDDYWTDTKKLQKQVDFMENNPAYSSCFHNVTIRSSKGENYEDRILHASLAKDSFDTNDLLGPWFIPSPSFFFRNYSSFDLPGWFMDCKYGDLPFMLLLSLRGPVKYLPEVMAVYRKHAEGMSEVHKNYDKIMVMAYIYTSFDVHTKFVYHAAVRDAMIYEISRHTPLQEPQTQAQSPGDSGFLPVLRKRAGIFYRRLRKQEK